MTIEQLSALINVRNFLLQNFDNINFALSKDQVKILRNKIVFMDKKIAEEMVKLNLDTLSCNIG